MKRLIDITKSRYHELGFREFIRLVFSALVKYEEIRVYWIRMASSQNVKSSKVLKYKIRKGKTADLDKERGLVRPTPWEFMCDIYDDVHDFFIAHENEFLEHISWVYYAGNPNRLLKLGKNDAEIKYCLTLQKYRGRGIYPVVLQEIIQYLVQRGIKNTYICVKEDNVASIRGIEKAGFKFIKEIWLVKIMGIQISKKHDVRKFEYDNCRENF